MRKDCEVFVKGNEEVEVMMETPERCKIGQIATGLNQFEESPVYNFLNSLSPIKPVKPVHITESINPLSFASLPSVFTSPHVTSLRESRFLRRHQVLDQPKLEFSTGNGNSIDTGKASMSIMEQLGDQQEDLDTGAYHSEVSGQTPVECENFVVDNEEKFIGDCNDTSSTLRPSSGNNLAEFSCSPSALVYGSEVDTEEAGEINQNKEATSCDWANMIVDASDMLIYESPNDEISYKKPVDSYSQFYSDNANDNPSGNEHVEEESALENLSTQPGEGNQNWENAEIQDPVSCPLVSNPSEKMDCENHCGLYRGIRRRCLVYEMAGSLRNHVDDKSILNSTVFGQPDFNVFTNSGSQLVQSNESTHCSLPSIGLHLNAIGKTSKNYKFVNHDSSTTGRILIGPSSSYNLHSATTDQEWLINTLTVSSMEENDTLIPAVDDCQTSECLTITNDEINHNSPKKKRKRMEQAGESDSSCKRCNCKKSKCLKLYCECFAAGVYCVEPCACIDCFNKPIHEETVLATRKQIESRNPLAFAPKVIRGDDSLTETGVLEDPNSTPASARHKRGCNCKKSGCLKKYCECFQGAVGCSANCRCEGCKNAFGRKDGTEVEYEDETDSAEKSMASKSFHKTSIHNDSDGDLDSVTPATPILTGRQPVKHLLSNKIQPRFSFPSLGSSGIYAIQSFGKPRFFQPPQKFDSQLETVNEDEIPDFLLEDSPISSIKASSPNSKRVSPPHIVAESSPAGLRTSRKMILQSISSFPSLSSNQ